MAVLVSWLAVERRLAGMPVALPHSVNERSFTYPSRALPFVKSLFSCSFQNCREPYGCPRRAESLPTSAVANQEEGAGEGSLVSSCFTGRALRARRAAGGIKLVLCGRA